MTGATREKPAEQRKEDPEDCWGEGLSAILRAIRAGVTQKEAREPATWIWGRLFQEEGTAII